MCDLFEANPWKPLLCTNCHQNRSAHSKMSDEIPTATSSMHLYEEIMAQYFSVDSTTSVNENIDFDVENDEIEEEDSFTDEEQTTKPNRVEFIPNQSMINTQGIVLIGPELKTKETPKKTKKIHLLRKTKSNADELLKKNETNETNSSKLRWFKAKKSQVTSETNKQSVSPPTPTTNVSARIRVLPEINKLTLNEALSIARRQHSSLKAKPTCSTAFPLGQQSTYGSSIDSTTSSSSTHSSNEYETNGNETTYLVATVPQENHSTPSINFDSILRSTLERLTFDLGRIIDEYKKHLPVAQFQTFKSLFQQHQSTKIFSTDSICFLLLQLIGELTTNSNSSTFENFLVAHHSTLPILVKTTGTTMNNDDRSIEQIIRDFAQPISSSSDLTIIENLCLRTLTTQFLQYSSTDFDQNLSTQRMKILDLFWTYVPSVRLVQINEANEHILFLLYYQMHRLI